MFELRIKARRHLLEYAPIAIKIAEVLLPSGHSHDILHFFVIGFYLFAQGRQQFLAGIPYTSGEHALAGLQMHVVSASLRVSAPRLRFARHAGGDEHTEPLFVRPLVVTESGVAIDAPYAVFGLQPFERRVNLCQRSNEVCREIQKRFVARIVTGFVGVKPVAVVMHGKVGEEI